jgi:hypothetical protein
MEVLKIPAEFHKVRKKMEERRKKLASEIKLE